MSKFFLFSIFCIIFIKQIIFANTQDDTYINTSNIIYDEKKNIIELYDNSKINIGNTNILVDRGIIDYNKDEVKIFGNFYLYQELNILSGKDLIGDTNLDNFTANEVSYIYNNDLKIDSEEAERKGDIVVFYDNFLTPCELNGYFNCPTWSLRIDKTEYNIQKDKFVHFDTFLQIADYKLFYLPYFSHYGAKAPRQKGFLPPSIEFTIGGNSGVKIPYYLPINQRADIKFTPTFLFNESFQFLENYKLNTDLEILNSGGTTKFVIDNIKNQGDTNINTSVNFQTKQVINSNSVLSANGVFTNSVSTTRSLNEEPITFQDIFIKLENYNLITNDDYLKSEISTVKSFEIGTEDTIPISPSINYYNNVFLSDNYSLRTLFDYTVLRRDASTENSPSENYIINFNNYLNHNAMFRNAQIHNKISYLNSFYDYNFEHNENIDREENSSKLILSSDLFFNNYRNLTPRIKLILPRELVDTDDIINEESKSISFNYSNQFSDNRFYGNDLLDNTPRVVYGIEKHLENKSNTIDLGINQSYDFNKNNNFANQVNQNNHFSDYSLEAQINQKLISFKADIRLDENTFTKKELNYLFTLDDPLKVSLNYNETNKNAYNGLSSDTQTLKFGLTKEINDNLNLHYNSNLDLKNNYSPYSSEFAVDLFDECSKLVISYSNVRYNDNYNTSPEEKISFTFSMDYLGFFGYEQSTDLLFEEPGNVNYGL